MSGSGRHHATVFSIGHSNHALDLFLSLLARHRIERLVDVRSQPVSRFAPYFNHPEIGATVRAAGVDYLFMGQQLGGRPTGGEFYDEEGYVLYDRVAGADWFGAGVDRLVAEAQAARVAMMCSEEDPVGCHRRLLIGRVLAERGVAVVHVRGDGRLQTEEELAAAAEAALDKQLTLFDVVGTPAWKSLRSVLPRPRPQTFLAD